MKQGSRRGSRHMRWSRFLGMIFIILLIMSLIFYGVHHKTAPLKQVVTLEIQKIKTWVMARKLKQQLAQKSKTLTSHTEDEQETIHYEFYTTLPAMHMSTQVAEKQKGTPT